MRKKAPKRKRRIRRKPAAKSKVPRSLVPKTFRFKRDLEETLQLSNTVAPEGWTLDGSFRIYRNLAWALSSVGDSTDFTNLFRQYRLKGARVRLYFSNTTSASDGGAFDNSQMLVRMSPNQRGENETLNNAYWQQIQAKQYKTALNGGKPVDIYMPLFVRNEVESSTGTAFSIKKPNFISTTLTNVAHHGINIAIERVDGQQFTQGSSNYQYAKMITTLYFETRGVE